MIESIKSRDDASVCKNKVCFNKTYENYQVSLLKTSKTTRKIRAMICLHDSSEIIAQSQNFFLLWYSVDDFSTHLIVSTFILPDITGRTAPGGGVLSGKVGTGMCGPDRVLFRALRFCNGLFFI